MTREVLTRRTHRPLRALSVFSGVGGLDLAARWGAEMAGEAGEAGEAGAIETVAMIENEPYCQQVLRLRFPEAVIYGDVRAVNRKRLEDDGLWSARGRRRIDLLYGGPPCQPASVAGKRRGADDDRWLWPEFLRLAGELRPRWIVAENPDGLRTVDAGRAFAGVLREFAALGYRVGWEVVAAADAGAPHRRERLCIVAYRDQHSGRRAQRAERGSVACASCASAHDEGHSQRLAAQCRGSSAHVGAARRTDLADTASGGA